MAKVNVVSNAGFLDTVFRLLKEDDSASRIARVFKMRGGVKSAGGNKWKFPYPQMGVLGAAEYAVKQLGGSIRPLGKEDGVNVAEITGPLHEALSANSIRSRNEVSVGFISGRNAQLLVKDGKWYYYDNGTGKDVGPFNSADDARKAAKGAGLTVINSCARSRNAVVQKALNARAVCNAGDPGHFTSDELSALKGAFAGLNGASFSQYPNKSREQLAVRGENGILITVQKFAFDGKPVEFDIRGQGPRSGFGVKFASSIREAVTTVKRMLASAKRQSPYSFSKYD